MRPLGHDPELLLVDLRKVPKGGTSISVAEFLVFVEVARYVCLWAEEMICWVSDGIVGLKKDSGCKRQVWEFLPDC